jgi:sarcosine oxidase subunit alpha
VHAAQLVDRSKPLQFTFDGRAIQAYEGETIGAALCAAGVSTLSRSFKYHRRRGLLCVSGRCPNCLMTVDGVPNVRACVEPVRPGAVARSQHAWPSLEHDFQAVFDHFDPFLPVGFYYKTFMRPKWLWPHYETVLRHLAGLGRIDITREPHEHTELVHLHTPVAVIGGGPAGMSAALEAARLGVEVILVDEQPKLGGHLQWHALASDGARPDYELGEQLSAQVRAQPLIRHFENASAFGLYEGNLLAVAQRDRLFRFRADRVIAATGAYEHPLVFQNNDLPGIFLATGILRLVRLYGVRPGRRAVVAANDDCGLRVARELVAAGIAVAAVADARPATGSAHARALLQSGVHLLPGYTVLEARGRARLETVQLVRVDNAGRPVAGSEREIAADVLVLATGWEPNAGLLAQSGCQLRYRDDLGAFVPDSLPEAVSAAGEVSGIRDVASILRHGTLAGLRAAVSLGRGGAADQIAAQAVVDSGRSAGTVRPLVGVSQRGSKQFVCLCEDVSTKDIRTAIEEGFDHIQTLKRYTTVTMGPCQGKMCHHASLSLCGEITGRGCATTGTTTARPPAAPVSLGILAGPAHDPVRRSPCHHQQTGRNPIWMDMGAWKRPLYYSSIEEECRAVHERVGIIDVSPLGKLDIQGADAAAFLDWMHPNRISNLRQGRIRYRLMLDDAGIIMDDGTVVRLGDDHFFLTTGTSALEGVEQWFEWWLAGGQRCTHVTNVTAAFGAINVAGPRSREVLRRLTDLDLSNEAVPYLATAVGSVAGVPALLLRIGFVGELGYEIHFPAEYGDYLWSTLLEAGRDFGIAPFGVEAQRVMRLEKLHIIPNHDTDALSNPFEANMSWAVKLEKSDFIGRAAVARQSAKPLRQRLVGFELSSGRVPSEGEVIVANGAPVGRVTSAKWSPLLKRGVGLAWVPVELAEPGIEIHIQSGKSTLAARVVGEPFYDAAGERLKS